MQMLLHIPFTIVFTAYSWGEYTRWKKDWDEYYTHRYESNKEFIHLLISLSLIQWFLIGYSVYLDLNN